MSSFGIHYLIGLCVTELHKVTRVSLCTTAASTSLASIGYRWKSKKIHKQSAVTLTSSGLTVIIIVAGTERPLYTEKSSHRNDHIFTQVQDFITISTIFGHCYSWSPVYAILYFINMKASISLTFTFFDISKFVWNWSSIPLATFCTTRHISM